MRKDSARQVNGGMRFERGRFDAVNGLTDAADMPKHLQYRVLYDDSCPFCASQIQLIRRLDWFEVIDPVPISEPRATQVAPQLTPEQRASAIHCVTVEGEIYRGAHCFRFISMRLPVLFPLAVILWIPGVIWIAEPVYRWISRNRYVLSRFFGCRIKLL